ncbi:zinc finger protein, putative, partial [Ixodes scapularis]
MFTKGTRLNWHMRLHTNERPFACTFEGCSSKYTRQYHLTRHVKAVHTPKSQAESPQDLRCPLEECGKQFSSKHTLYKHVNISHKKRRFKCELCPKTYVKHQQLKIHSYEHTKVLPYPCTEPGCDRAFLLPSRLKAHQRCHQGRGYKCTVGGCTRVFSKWSLLRKHRKVDHQKSFSCHWCDRVFYSKSSVESHQETHQSDRETFCCPHEGCGRFYLHQRNLHDHIRKAHENKRFACDAPGCSRTFFAK